MPKRIQRKRIKGWRMPEGAIYVGRPSKWGNPFTGPCAVEKYTWALEMATETRLAAWIWAGGKRRDWFAMVATVPSTLNELRGHDLACWCPLDKPCHADILLVLANKDAK